jgi:hypothetical protein
VVPAPPHVSLRVLFVWGGQREAVYVPAGSPCGARLHGRVFSAAQNSCPAS